MTREELIANMEIIKEVVNKYRPELLKEYFAIFERNDKLMEELGLGSEVVGLKESYEIFMNMTPPEGLDIFTLACIINSAAVPIMMDVWKEVKDGKKDFTKLFESAAL